MWLANLRYAFISDPKKALIAIAVGVLGVSLIVAGTIQQWSYFQLVLGGKEAQAEIVDIQQGVGFRRNRRLFPVFQFEANGQIFKAVSRQAINVPSGAGPFQRGDRISILYDPRDPAFAEIKRKGMNPFIAQIICGLLAVTYFFYLVRRL